MSQIAKIKSTVQTYMNIMEQSFNRDNVKFHLAYVKVLGELGKLDLLSPEDDELQDYREIVGNYTAFMISSTNNS